jgi:hypothetical protein
MSLIKFKVYFEEDSDIFRDIEVLSAQTFYELHQCIRTNFQIAETVEASIFLCDESYQKEREISSVVEKNLRDAPALSMKRTPIGALLSDPHQKFVYVTDNDKKWHFHLDVITFKEDPPDANLFPRCIKSEGLSPSQFGLGLAMKARVLEVEEKYDLASKDGFGDEGEDEIATEEDGGESAMDDNFTDDL